MPTPPAPDLPSLSLGDLLTLHSGIGMELKRRGASRTGNNPCSDFAELLVTEAFGWAREPNSNTGFDATTPDGQRIEIKARRITPSNPSRQASAIRKIDTQPFDRLIGVVFAPDYSVLLGVDVPFAVVRARATHVTHTNSAKFHLRDDLVAEPGVVDITRHLRQVAARLLSER